MIAAIQAGGKSSRMGRAKAFIEIGGMKLIERVLDAAKPVTEELYVVTSNSGSDEDEYARIANVRGAECLRDLSSHSGPLGGIEAALTTCDADDSAMVLACDLPFLTSDFLALLRAQHEQSDSLITVAVDPEMRVQPLVAIYRQTCLSTVQQQIAAGRFRIDLMFDQLSTRRVEPREYRHLSGYETLFLNLNSADDVERARAHTGESIARSS